MLKPLSIYVSPAGPRQDITIVALNGQLDSITSSQVERVLDDLVKKRSFRIVVDLANVSYVSSAGWGIFLGVLKEIRLNQGDLKLSGLSSEVMKIVKLLEIDHFLPTFHSSLDAIRDFS